MLRTVQAAEPLRNDGPIDRPPMLLTGLRQHHDQLRRSRSIKAHARAVQAGRAELHLDQPEILRDLPLQTFVRRLARALAWFGNARVVVDAPDAVAMQADAELQRELVGLIKAVRALGPSPTHSEIEALSRHMAGTPTAARHPWLVSILAASAPEVLPMVPNRCALSFYAGKLLSTTRGTPDPLIQLAALAEIARDLAIPPGEFAPLLRARFGPPLDYRVVPAGTAPLPSPAPGQLVIAVDDGGIAGVRWHPAERYWPMSALHGNRLQAAGSACGATPACDTSTQTPIGRPAPPWLCLEAERFMQSRFDRRRLRPARLPGRPASQENGLQVMTSATDVLQDFASRVRACRLPLVVIVAWELQPHLSIGAKDRLHDLLVEAVAARRGRVAIVWNACTVHSSSKAALEALRAQIEPIRQALPSGLRQRLSVVVYRNDRGQLKLPLLGTARRTIAAHHEKLAYVADLDDPAVPGTAYCGGVDFSFVAGGYWETARPGSAPSKAVLQGEALWRDVTVRLEGAEAEPIGIYAARRLRGTVPRTTSLGAFGADPEAFAEILERSAVPRASSTARPGRVAFRTNARRRSRRVLLQDVLQTIDQAHEHIYVEHQYFRHPAVTRRLRRALRAKPHLRLTVVVPGMTDELATLADEAITARERYVAAVQDGRRDAVHELRTMCRLLDPVSKAALAKQARNLRRLASHPRARVWFAASCDGERYFRRPYVHSKVLMADRSVAIVGSANLNRRSLDGWLDTEAQLVIRDPKAVAAVRAASFLPVLQDAPTAAGQGCKPTRLPERFAIGPETAELRHYTAEHARADLIMSRMPKRPGQFYRYVLTCSPGNIAEVTKVLRAAAVRLGPVGFFAAFSPGYRFLQAVLRVFV